MDDRREHCDGRVRPSTTRASNVRRTLRLGGCELVSLADGTEQTARPTGFATDLQKTPCNVLLATWRTEQHTTWQHSPGHNCLPRALSVKSFQAIRGHSGATDANRYVTTYASSHTDASHNFTFVTVRGAGHMVPQVSAPCRYCMICDVCGGCALCRVPLNMAAST